MKAHAAKTELKQLQSDYNRQIFNFSEVASGADTMCSLVYRQNRLLDRAIDEGGPNVKLLDRNTYRGSVHRPLTTAWDYGVEGDDPKPPSNSTLSS